MEHFHFNQWNCSAEEAMTILNCSKRTIQNYYHPTKRDPIKWEYLELIVSKRVLPKEIGVRYHKKKFCTDTGFEFKPYELTQWELFQSFKTNEIIELKQKIEQLEKEISNLTQRITHKKQASNVIAFPTKQHGDVIA